MKNEELIQQLVTSFDPKRKMRPQLLYPLWLLAFLLICILSLSILGLRPDLLSSLFRPAYQMEIFPVFLFTLLTGHYAIKLSIPGERINFDTITVLLVASLSYLVLSVGYDFIYRPEMASKVFLGAGLKCLSGILLVSAGSTMIMIKLLRSLAPTQMKLTSLMAVSSGTAMSVLTISLYCTIDQALHHVLWVFVPALAIHLMGVRICTRFLRW